MKSLANTFFKNRLARLYVCVFIITVVSSIVHAQTVHVVDNNQGAGAQFTSLQNAIDAATEGDIVYVQPSPNSYGSINLTKSLTLYGAGHRPELNAGLSAKIADIYFTGNASGTKLSGLQINRIYLQYSSSNNDIVISNNRISEIYGNSSTSLANNVIITGNFFYTNVQSAIDVYNSQNWVVTHNLFQRESTYFDYQLFYRFNSSTIFNNNIILSPQIGNSGQVVRLFRDSYSTPINNCIFLFRGTNVQSINTGDTVVYNNCLTYSLNSTIDALSGTNNIDNQNPQFTNLDINGFLNSTGNDFTIQTGSPAKNAGTDGNDLGVENGGYPFTVRGYPTELPYITEFTVYNNVVSPSTPLNVNIKANANITN